MFGKKKPKNQDVPLPSPYVEPERYEGRPLLVILENYILDCIGELSTEQQEGLTNIVQKSFGGNGDWKKTVRDTLQLDESIDEHFQQMWRRNCALAKEHRTELHPVQFAKMVVDKNFAHLLNDR